MFKSLWLSLRWAVLPTLLGFLLFGVVFPPMSWNVLLAHGIIEAVGGFISILLALFITSMVLTKRLTDNYIWLIISFLSMGTLDLAHSLIHVDQEFVWLHSSAVFLGGVFASLIWLPISISHHLLNFKLVGVVLLLATGFSLGSVLFPELTITMLDPNRQFTLGAHVLNNIGGTGFIIAWFYFFRAYQKEQKSESIYLSNQLFLFGVSALLFEFSSLWNGEWWFWHLLRAIAYIILIVYFSKIYWDDLNIFSKHNKALQLSSRIFSGAHEGIIVTDTAGIIIDVNPAFCEITGFSHKEAIGSPPSILNSGKQSPEFYSSMWHEVKTSGYWQGEIWNRKKSGEIYAEMLTISSLKDVNNNTINFVGLFSDITLRKEQNDRLELLAHYDSLTKLPNRILLTDRFNQAVSISRRTDTLLAVCFIDLDDFKLINDSYSHEVGDKLLIEVAGRLVSAIRHEDTVSRLGGDEFILLLGEIQSTEECSEILERTVNLLREPYHINGQVMSVGASIGISLFRNDNEQLDSLLREADQAMYQAKQSGKNSCCFFDASESLKLANKQAILNEIEHALENDEFRLFYQPKVNMLSGEVFGLEALIRWQHPDKGIIPPSEFLPIIDRTDLEILIGDWVIRTALDHLKLWSDLGIKLSISVNIAAHHLISPHFYNNLDTALAQVSDIESKYFQLEVLESSVLSDLDSIGDILSSCQNKLGITVALDDFGTGYSSLSHLTRIPANTIKIDQSFVRDVLVDPDDYAIIDGVIGLAHSFNREVIAEGVETTEHGQMLILMGCNNAQGYAISKPIPADSIPNWLDNYQPNEVWLAFPQEGVSLPEKTTLTLKLILNYWLTKFEHSVKSAPSPSVDEHINFNFNFWLKFLRNKKIFSDSWIDELKTIYDSVDTITIKLSKKHQKANHSLATNDLGELYSALEKMYKTISNPQ